MRTALPIRDGCFAAALALAAVFPLGFGIASIVSGSPSVASLFLTLVSAAFLVGSVALLGGFAWARQMLFWLCSAAFLACAYSILRLLQALQTPRSNLPLLWGYVPGHVSTYSALALTGFGILAFALYAFWLARIRSRFPNARTVSSETN